MSALNEKIDNRARGSGATHVKLTAYEIGVRLVGSEMCIRDRYGLGLAISDIYNAYVCIPISIKLLLSSACERS